MRLVTFQSEDGIRHGILRGEPDNGTVVDLGPGDLLGLIEAGGGVGTGPERAASGVRLLAPLLRPPKLLALARNYQDHITEGGGQPVDKQRVVPKLFLKPSSAILGPDAPLCLPSVSSTTDWEVELAVVIGARCRDVSVENALDVVFGYTIANDVSARTTDWGVERDPDVWNQFFDWLCGKWPDGFAPLGPYILTRDEVADPQNLELSLSVNGERRQRSTTREMISTVAETIAFASRFMTLEPGDIIETGTPSGVGATTGTYLKSGDVMEGAYRKTGHPAHARAMTRPRFDLVIANGTLVDGTGAARRSADLGISDGRVAAIGDLAQADAAQRIDAQQRVVCPGLHRRPQSLRPDTSERRPRPQQSPPGRHDRNRRQLRARRRACCLARGYRRHPRRHLHRRSRSVSALDVAVDGRLPPRGRRQRCLDQRRATGGSPRHSCQRDGLRRPSRRQRTSCSRMQTLLDSALGDGAIGVSTGLMYAPISYAGLDELVALGEVAARYDRVFAMHMRNYGDHLLDAVDEAMQVGERSGCRVQASHLAVVGRRNWGTIARRARAHGSGSEQRRPRPRRHLSVPGRQRQPVAVAAELGTRRRHARDGATPARSH